MLPHHQILLKRCNCQINTSFFDLCDVASPLEEGCVLLPGDLLCCHVFRPAGPLGNFQRPESTACNSPIGDELLDHGRCRVCEHFLPRCHHRAISLRLEITPGELSQLHKLFDGILVQDRCQSRAHVPCKRRVHSEAFLWALIFYFVEFWLVLALDEHPPEGLVCSDWFARHSNFVVLL